MSARLMTDGAVMRTATVRALTIGMMVLSLILLGSAQAASPADKLKAAQQRLDEVRDRLEEVGAECERNENRVDRINGRVEDALVAVGDAEIAVDQQRRVADAAEQRLEQLEVQAQIAQDVSSSRVVELYKRGVADPTLQSLLNATSSEQALGRAQVLNVVKHGDREALEEVLASRTAVGAQRKLFERQQSAYESALGERQRIVGQLEELRATYEHKIARCNEQVVKLEQQERIAAADEEKLSAALADRGEVSVPPSASAGGWAWPARGPVTSGFGYRWGRLHAGIDIGAPTGAPIYAAKGGVVSYAGVMGGYGNIVVVDHGGGMTTRYAHQSRLAASVGQTVRPGDQIGYVGSTGNVTGPHLHFEVRINDQPQDPIGYLP
jgi:murein DD-endopeptidase MepM/ murein hydrolase activator NlpD